MTDRQLKALKLPILDPQRIIIGNKEEFITDQDKVKAVLVTITIADLTTNKEE